MQNLLTIIRDIRNKTPSPWLEQKIGLNKYDIILITNKHKNKFFISFLEFFEIYDSNLTLYISYYGDVVQHELLAKMILFQLWNEEECSEEQLDEFIEKKSFE